MSSALATVSNPSNLPDVVAVQFKVQEFELHLTSDVIYKSCSIFMATRPTARYRSSQIQKQNLKAMVPIRRISGNIGSAEFSLT